MVRLHIPLGRGPVGLCWPQAGGQEAAPWRRPRLRRGPGEKTPQPPACRRGEGSREPKLKLTVSGGTCLLSCGWRGRNALVPWLSEELLSGPGHLRAFPRTPSLELAAGALEQSARAFRLGGMSYCRRLASGSPGRTPHFPGSLGPERQSWVSTPSGPSLVTASGPA